MLKLETGCATRVVVCGKRLTLDLRRRIPRVFHSLSNDVFIVRFVSTSLAFSFRRRSVPS